MISHCSNRLRLLISTSVFLAGCAATQPREQEWPSKAVPKGYFVEAYKADASNQLLQTEQEYLRWVERFYDGAKVYGQGWIATQRIALDGVDENTHHEVADKLKRIGRLIAADWAKDNSVRRITNAMLSTWRQVLFSAVDSGTSVTALDQIRQDVDALLAGRLSPGVIEIHRYAEWLDAPEPMSSKLDRRLQVVHGNRQLDDVGSNECSPSEQFNRLVACSEN